MAGFRSRLQKGVTTGMRALARFRMNRKNEIMGFLLLSLAAILFLSLASYDPMDTPTYTSAPNTPAHNAVGVAGAYMAESLLFLVGIAAYLLPLILLIWAWNTFWGNVGKDIYLKLIGLATMLLSLSGLAHMFDISVQGSRFRAGGIMAPYISDLLSSMFGMTGAGVVAFSFLLISILLTTEFLFFSFALAVGAISLRMLTRVCRFAYEGVTGRSGLPGGLSIAPKKRPPKIAESGKKVIRKISRTARPADKATRKGTCRSFPKGSPIIPKSHGRIRVAAYLASRSS
jgi:DNA segregation ATPase FtsK/SpoIIIE-like protein